METKGRSPWSLIPNPCQAWVWGSLLLTPHMLRTHTYWPMGVKGGLLEVFPGCFRNWLSRWRSLFSSHMFTEALWEAL